MRKKEKIYINKNVYILKKIIYKYSKCKVMQMFFSLMRRRD
jgi:hypothetical protein